MNNKMKNKIFIITTFVLILIILDVVFCSYIYMNKNIGPGYFNVENVIKEDEEKKEIDLSNNRIVKISTDSNLYIHDGVIYKKGEDKGRFSLSGYCACKKCSSGTGITYSGAHVRENHTIAADLKVLPIGSIIILENATGKDGQVYDGVYVVEDKGGGVKNNHLDIYRPTHELASLVTHYGRAYGEVFVAKKVDIASLSELEKKSINMSINKEDI